MAEDRRHPPRPAAPGRPGTGQRAPAPEHRPLPGIPATQPRPERSDAPEVVRALEEAEEREGRLSVELEHERTERLRLQAELERREREAKERARAALYEWPGPVSERPGPKATPARVEVGTQPPPSRGSTTAMERVVRALGGGPGVSAILVALGVGGAGTAAVTRAASGDQADRIERELAGLREDVRSIRHDLSRLQTEQSRHRDRLAALVRSEQTFRDAVGAIICESIGTAPGLCPDDVELHAAPLRAPKIKRVQPKVSVQALPEIEPATPSTSVP